MIFITSVQCLFKQLQMRPAFDLAASWADCIFKSMTLRAIIHKAEEGGFWAEVPALPGCMTQGETIAEVKSNVREAVELWLSVGEETSSFST
jgi:predicted RNase H-like HicB family nuclease